MCRGALNDVYDPGECFVCDSIRTYKGSDWSSLDYERDMFERPDNSGEIGEKVGWKCCQWFWLINWVAMSIMDTELLNLRLSLNKILERDGTEERNVKGLELERKLLAIEHKKNV